MSTRILAMVAAVMMIIPAMAGAETVLVAVNETAQPENPEPSGRYYLSAVEAGAMDVLFENGHIVFNAAGYEVEGDSSIQRRYTVRDMAKDGGAGYALHIEMEFLRPDAEEVVPETARYVMVDIGKSDVIGQGRISVTPEEDKSMERVLFEVGNRIATDVSEAW